MDAAGPLSFLIEVLAFHLQSAVLDPQSARNRASPHFVSSVSNTEQLPTFLTSPFQPTRRKNMKSIVLIASLLAASVAFANDVDPNGFEKQHAIASATRADVKADLKAAQQQALLPIGELGVKSIDMPSIKSRAEVAAEASKGSHSYGELGQASVE
jgi:hypothetical protein